MSIFRFILIGLLAIFFSTNSVFAKIYPDVPVNHKHYTAISMLTTKGTVKGYPNGEFHPEGLINRAEAVKVMTKSLYPPQTIDSALQWHQKANHNYIIFPDVPIWEWYSKYVEVSFQNHVIQGYPDGTFKPANNINFAEALKVILESYHVDFSQNRYQANKLLYIEPGAWYEKYFTYASAHNLINPNKFYHPAQLITRSEFVEIIYRLENVLQNRLPKFVSTEQPTSNEYKITIPKLNVINVDVNFANLYDKEDGIKLLKYGLGHYLSPPDAGKKMVLFGHSSGYAWDHSAYKTVLREINKLNNGDKIYINYKEKGYVYEIYNTSIISATQDYTLVQDTNTNELALYTCWPPDSLRQRYVIYGKPI